MQSKRQKRRWRRVFIFLLVLCSGYLLVCLSLAKLYVSPFRIPPPQLANFKRIKMADGEPIWISPGLQSGNPHGKTLFVMSHGLGGGVGHYSNVANQLIKTGCDVVLTEMPAHGDSPDANCTFGAKESDIIVDATKWASVKYKK